MECQDSILFTEPLVLHILHKKNLRGFPSMTDNFKPVRIDFITKAFNCIIISWFMILKEVALKFLW